MFNSKQLVPLIIVGLATVVGCGTEGELDDFTTEVKEIPSAISTDPTPTPTPTPTPICPDPVAEEGIQAGVVVSPDDATVDTFYGAVSASPPTALDALIETGIDVVTADFGAFGVAICAIDGVGQPADNCFGDPDSKFWGFFIRNLGGEWMSAAVGADAYEIQDGDSIAFLWTASDPTTFDPLRTPDENIDFCEAAAP